MAEKYLIGYVSHILNVSKDTLRYYDKLGIVSPKKDTTNNYRYYTLQDLLSLSYAFMLRDLDVSLEEIRSFIKVGSLDDFSQLLDRQEQVLEEKMLLLQRTQGKVNDFKIHLQTIQAHLGKCRITMSPAFVYHTTPKEWDASYTGLLAAMEKNPSIILPAYSVMTSKATLKEHFSDYLSCGISGILNDLSDPTTIANYTYIPPQYCVHTVVAIDELTNTVSYDVVNQYLLKHHLEIADVILSRNLAFEHHNLKPIEYYELWIPIKSS